MSEDSGKVKSGFRVHLWILVMEVLLPFLLYLALQAGNNLLAMIISAILAAGLIALVFIQ